MSPNYTFQANYNGRCSEKELFVTSGLQKREIDKSLNPATSSSQSNQERLRSREIPSPWGIAQIEIQKEASGGEMTRNPHLKHWREREMD
jgi:hypothetical protein